MVISVNLFNSIETEKFSKIIDVLGNLTSNKIKFKLDCSHDFSEPLQFLRN